MKALWNFIIILIITIAVLLGYSFYPKSISFFGIELKKTDWVQYFVRDTAPIVAMKALVIEDKKYQLDSTSQNILLIGDSMLEQLRKAFNDYCLANNHTLNCVIWYSSQSQWFGAYDTLSHFIKLYKPTYVFLVLGANELFVQNIKEKRAKYVKRIVSVLDSFAVPFVWVGPPNWKEDTGINDLILQYAGYDRFFATYKISLNNPNFKRFQDGAHPLPQSAYYWMEELAKWVMTYSRKPILLKKPEVFTQKIPKTEILQPLAQ